MQRVSLAYLFLCTSILALLCCEGNSNYYLYCTSSTSGSSCSSGCCYKSSSSSSTRYCSFMTSDCSGLYNAGDTVDAVITASTGIIIGSAVGSVVCVIITIIIIVCIVKAVNRSRDISYALPQQNTQVQLGFNQNTTVPDYNVIPINSQGLGLIQQPTYGTSNYGIPQPNYGNPQNMNQPNNYNASWNPNI